MMRFDFQQLVQEMGESKNKSRDFAVNLGKTVGILLLTVILGTIFVAAHTSSDPLLMLYFISVFAVSIMTPRFAYGIAAAVFASLAYLFLVVEPYFGFTSFLQLPLTLAAMLTLTLLSSSVIHMLKLQAYRAQRIENRTALLFHFNEDLTDANNITEILSISTDPH